MGTTIGVSISGSFVIKPIAMAYTGNRAECRDSSTTPLEKMYNMTKREIITMSFYNTHCILKKF